MATIAYIRKSTDKQSFEHQEFEIKEYARKNNLKIDRWVEESISSRKELKKRKLGELLEELQEGDCLICSEISRLSRSVGETFLILQTLISKNCQVITIKENYHLGNDLQSQVLAFAFGLSSQIERDLISQRTKCSLDAKKAAGIKLGRPFGAESKKLKLSKNTKRIRDLLDKKVPKAQIARIMGVQKITLRRFIKRMGWKD
jgi:DNA invertase Pin-like site-specific DNA recombinase